ncbi:hypothetical protein HanPI659440_Chr02g0082521 [Helianthus annuus]|nr:hypothetical protein HanPI659440_Chr02g0082521 [Helianthus annuus]
MCLCMMACSIRLACSIGTTLSVFFDGFRRFDFDERWFEYDRAS